MPVKRQDRDADVEARRRRELGSRFEAAGHRMVVGPERRVSKLGTARCERARNVGFQPGGHSEPAWLWFGVH